MGFKYCMIYWFQSFPVYKVLLKGIPGYLSTDTVTVFRIPRFQIFLYSFSTKTYMQDVLPLY